MEPPSDSASAHTPLDAQATRTTVPPAAKWLGALGAAPFIALAIASLFLKDPPLAQASFALATYGAVILSFLGGIHWGLAIGGFGPGTSDADSYRRLIVSVVPSLIGWGALLLSTGTTLVVLAMAFAGMLWVDVRATQHREAPPWYPRLRWPLTIAVVASLTLGALA